MNLVKINSINIWDEEWEVGSLDSQTGQDYPSSTNIRSVGYIPVIPNTTLYGFNGAGAGMQFCWYDKNKVFVGQGSFISPNPVATVPRNVFYMRFRTYNAYGTTYNHDIQICLNSEAEKTTYHPHWVLGLDGQGKAMTCDISQMLPEGIGVVDLGNCNWVYHPSGGAYTDYFDTMLPTDCERGKSDEKANILCYIYTVIPSGRIATTGYDNKVIAIANTTTRCIVCDKGYTDATTFRQAMQGVLLFYKKATT